MIPLSLTELIALQDEAEAIEDGSTQPEIRQRAIRIFDCLQAARARRQSIVAAELEGRDEALPDSPGEDIPFAKCEGAE